MTIRKSDVDTAKAEVSDLSPNAILTSQELARWRRVSVRTIERERLEGTGIPYLRLSDRLVGYRVRDVLAWLDARTFTSTSAATVAAAKAEAV